jgi:hypothetical protein
MKLAWLTDIHLNFLKAPAREAFYQPLANLTVKTGKAEYYHPEIQAVFDV